MARHQSGLGPPGWRYEARLRSFAGRNATWLLRVRHRDIGGNQVLRLPSVRVAMAPKERSSIWWRNGDPVANCVVRQHRRQPGRPTTSSSGAPVEKAQADGPRRRSGADPTDLTWSELARLEAV